jgi:DMSO/TMAO reductase YedYZ heme-binding membrane subunit
MTLIITLILTPFAALVLRKPLMRCPSLFYLLATIAAAIGIYLSLSPQPNIPLRAIAVYMQHGNLPFALFALVMYIGIFSETSKLRRLFVPIRAQLSVIASILVIGHIAPYLSNYLSLLSGIAGLKINVLISLILALLLLVLLVILAVTSFNFVKRHMSAESWKRLQWWAYPFFILIWAHLLMFLLPSALLGGTAAVISVIIYSVLFVIYLAAKITLKLRSRKAQQTQ